MPGKKKVLFVCTHNSARSQIAEALLNKVYGDRFEAHSAGTSPRSVNPYAARVLAEEGIDISNRKSKSVDEFSDTEFDYVVTVCDSAKESCPYFSGGKKYIHKSFQDPSLFRGGEDEILLGFRRIRDDIRRWLKKEFK